MPALDNTPWPDFELFSFFAGSSRAWGIFEDRFGILRRSFVVDIKGEVSGNQLCLRENFVYDDGEQAQRVWYITALGQSHYSGTAADIPGVAAGFSDGAKLRWKYVMRLTTNNISVNVRVDDHIYRLPDGSALSRGYISKWGIRLGSVTLFFKQQAH
ncbi:DUF3833 family protein [Pontibacter sp. JAM-7]|uniref:DUF3833 family protein n=1 Tax=Pontibacter sp. JAM-7 TaxID=3366581 RepID=UPI003AF8AEA2